MDWGADLDLPNQDIKAGGQWGGGQDKACIAKEESKCNHQENEIHDGGCGRRDEFWMET